MSEETASERQFRNEPVLELRRSANRVVLSQALADLDRRLPLDIPVLIGGERASGSGIESTDPGEPEHLVASAAVASSEQVDEAVRLAGEGGAEWGRRPARERAEALLRAAAILRERRGELAALEVRECAKPWEEADADVCEAIDFLTYYAHGGCALAKPPSLLEPPGERNSLRYVPRGVVGVISPWNFPIAIAAGMTSAALATGNAALLKPAEQSPACALALVEALHEGGVPADALALLPGYGETGAAVVRHPGVHAIAFTGSSVVGQAIIRRAAEVREGDLHIKRVIAEMGGKNCVIVDSDADLDEVVPEVIASAFGFAGQKCSACARVLVHEAIAETLATRLAGAVEALEVGEAERFGIDVPPVIERDSQERLAAKLELGAASGRVLARNSRIPVGGHYCEPALVAELPSDSPLLHEETFGPLLTIEPVTSVEAACELVEALPFALTGGLFCRDPRTVAKVEERLPVGNLYVNRGITGAMVGRQPFGGNRLSGIGSKAGGPGYLEQFVESRVVSENTMRHGLELG